MNSNLQLCSWIISCVIGFLYSFSLYVFKTLTIKFSVIAKVFLSLIYVVFMSISIIYTYYKVNMGYINYSYVVFWVLGFSLFNIVKSYVKRHKN